ncbi:MAG: roadblock/LC7 domain-containing protein [Verrucomicrobiota bacterium]
MMFSESNQTSAGDRDVAASGFSMRDDFGMSSMEIAPGIYEAVSGLLVRYRSHVELDMVALLDESGMPVASSGGDDLPAGRMDALGALATGAFGSMQALAERLGEEKFEGCFHHGRDTHFHLYPVESSLLLVSVFGARVPSGLVGVYSQRVAEAISGAMVEKDLGAASEKAGAGVGFADGRGTREVTEWVRAEAEEERESGLESALVPESIGEALVAEEVMMPLGSDMGEEVGPIAVKEPADSAAAATAEGTVPVTLLDAEGGNVEATKSDDLPFLQEQLKAAAQARDGEDGLPFLQDLEPAEEAMERRVEDVFSVAPLSGEEDEEPFLETDALSTADGRRQEVEPVFEAKPLAGSSDEEPRERTDLTSPVFGGADVASPAPSPFSIDAGADSVFRSESVPPQVGGELGRAVGEEPASIFTPVAPTYQSPPRPDPQPEAPGTGAFVGRDDPPAYATGPRPSFGAVAPPGDSPGLVQGGGEGLVLPPPPREAGDEASLRPPFKSPFTMDEGGGGEVSPGGAGRG